MGVGGDTCKTRGKRSRFNAPIDLRGKGKQFKTICLGEGPPKRKKQDAVRLLGLTRRGKPILSRTYHGAHW